MRKETITKTVVMYDPGDILDISAVRAKTQKPEVTEAKYGLVLARNGNSGYKILTERNKASTLKAEELENAVFLESLDFDKWNVLTGGENGE